MKKDYTTYLEADSIYKAFKINSFDEYIQKWMPNFYLIDSVPEDVRKEIEIVEHLFCFGYLNYKVLDEALFKLTRVLEMALKIKYQVEEGKEFKKNFEKAIDWAFRKFEFEVKKDFIHSVRKQIRNPKAHAKRHSFGGAFIVDWFVKINSP